MAFKDLGIEGLVELGPDGRPVFIKPITADDLRGFSPSNPEDVAKLNQVLIATGVSNPSEIRRQSTKYLERWNYEPGTEAYERALDKLISDTGSKKVLLGQARRAAERAELLTLTKGNVRQQCVRVPEGPDPCPACLELIGETGTIGELAANNSLPGDQCYGGDLCMCRIIPIN